MLVGLRVALGQPAHEAVGVPFGPGPQDEVPVIAHQAPNEQAYTETCVHLCQLAVVDLVVRLGCACVGAVHPVVDDGAYVGLQGAQHEGTITQQTRGAKSPALFSLQFLNLL